MNMGVALAIGFAGGFVLVGVIWIADWIQRRWWM